MRKNHDDNFCHFKKIQPLQNPYQKTYHQILTISQMLIISLMKYNIDMSRPG